MGRRTILLIAAVLVAALGAGLVWMYANRAEDKALAGQEPVEVLVATVQIPAGTSGSAMVQAGSVELRTLATASVPAQALSDITPVQDLVTLAPVYPGQVLLQPMFGSQGQTAGGLTLPEGTVGVSVQLGDPQRVAGFVKPGSEVAVFVTVAGAGGEGQAQTAVLLERVPVVAVGPTVTTTAGTNDGQSANTESIPTAILTLALTQEQAQKVIQSTSSGFLYLALLDANSEIDPRTKGTTTESLLD